MQWKGWRDVDGTCRGASRVSMCKVSAAARTCPDTRALNKETLRHVISVNQC